MSDLLNHSLTAMTDEVVASYRSDDRTQRVGQRFLPSRERIVAILDEVRALLFPGYFGHKRLTQENVHYHVGNLLIRLAEELSEEVRHCMCATRQCGEDCSVRCQTEAEEIARKFLQRIPHVRAMLAEDAQAAYDGDPAAKSIDEIIYCYPGFYAVMVYRVAHELLKLGVALMPRILTEHAHSITGCDIHPGATIGRSFFIDHATGVVIGETAEIGDHVKIYQGVTLGALSFPKDERGRAIKGLKRHPTIEDNVTIYSNVSILGGQTVIGRGVTVGGNTFVTSSIAPGQVAFQETPGVQVRDKTKRGKES